MKAPQRPDAFMAQADIAVYCGFSKQYVSEIRDQLPRPYSAVESGRKFIWRRGDIERWFAQYRANVRKADSEQLESIDAAA